MVGKRIFDPFPDHSERAVPDARGSVMAVEISVVMTLYRDGDFLEEAIDSVLRQTFTDFELILVDNNADEATMQVARKYQSRFPDIIRIVQETTQGISSARNRGIREAAGQYIAMLDGDDLMRHDRLEKQREVAIAHPEAILIASSFEVFVLENGEKVFLSKQRDIHLDWVDLLFKSQKDPFLRDFYIPLPSTLFFEREKILELGGFDPFFDGRAGEEINFALVSWKKGRFIHMDEFLVLYRAKSKNLKNVSTKSWIRRTERQDRLIKVVNTLYFNSSSENVSGKPVRQLISIWLRETALHYFSCREGKRYARTLLWRSLSFNELSIETWKMVFKSFFPEKYYPKIFWFKTWDHLPKGIDHEFFVKRLFAKTEQTQ